MKKRVAFLVVVILTFVCLPGRDEDIWNQSLEKISSIISLVEQNYAEDVEPEKLIYSSIRGMLQTLDPHSYFLDPDNFLRMKEEQTGKYYGLGIQIQKHEDRLVVIAPIEGTPAYRLGIQAGDIISHINGESTKPISSFEALEKLRGPKGTKVTITIVREGLERPLELTIVREEISLHSVPYAFLLQDDVGYIFIRNFAETTGDEFEEKMDYLAAKGIKSLILDLRSNSGGHFFQSLEISDEFLPRGGLIVSIKGRNREYNQEFRALRDNQHEKLPLVVLIDRGSFSASEIVAGAVMDNDRGLLVGEPSWGKGLVQTIFPLAPNLAVALTTARYFTPSGRSIQRDYSQLEDYFLVKETPTEKKEVKYTVKGRKVLGQGGITPDYEVKVSAKPYTFELMIRGTFFSYARKFVGHQTPLSKKFVFPRDEQLAGIDFSGKIIVGQNFVVDSQIIEDFKDYLRTSKIEFDPEKFKEAEPEIKRELEREMVSSLWGIEEGIKAYRKSDPVILKAIEILPEAIKLIEEENSPNPS